MEEEKDKKKVVPSSNQWVQDARVTSGGTSSQTGHAVNKQRTEIDIDPNADYFKSVNVDYSPGTFSYNPDDADGFFAQMRKYAQKPEFDEERAKRIGRIAKVNALGDLMKHLGAFAGGGYAPTTKREENRNVLRAFQELDKMRDAYNSQLERYNRDLAGYYAAGRSETLQRFNADEARRMNLAIDKANREQRVLDRMADIALKRGTTQISESDSSQTGTRANWQNSSKNMLNTLLGRGNASKKDDVFTYRDTDGVFNLDKSRLTQFYSTLEKNRDKIKEMPTDERKRLGIGDDGAIDKDLEIMIAALTGKISLNDANFQRIASKYMNAFRDSDMMKYVLAGSFVPYSEQPVFTPKRTEPYEMKKSVTDSSSADTVSGYDYSKMKF